MKYWIDTEFIDAGPNHPIELLSIAVVAEDDRFFYGENGEASFDGANDWVRVNVIAHMHESDAFHYHDLRNNILHLIGDDPEPEFWGWCCDYDYVLMSQLIGFNRWPSHWPHYFRDIQQTADELDTDIDDLFLVSTQHHALSDAKRVRKLWDHLIEIQG